MASNWARPARNKRPPRLSARLTADVAAKDPNRGSDRRRTLRVRGWESCLTVRPQRCPLSRLTSDRTTGHANTSVCLRWEMEEKARLWRNDYELSLVHCFRIRVKNVCVFLFKRRMTAIHIFSTFFWISMCQTCQSRAEYTGWQKINPTRFLTTV